MGWSSVRSGRLTTSIKPRSIEWPGGIMGDEVDTEWCRGLSTDEGPTSRYTCKPGLASGPTLPHRGHL
jgi:hypothetical protein